MKTIIVVLSLAVSLAFAVPAHAAGSAEAGKALAQRWCANCHAMEGAAAARDGAPSLSVIARRHANDNAWLKIWLAAPHSPMPDPGLSRQQIDDIVAFLEKIPR